MLQGCIPRLHLSRWWGKVSYRAVVQGYTGQGEGVTIAKGRCEWIFIAQGAFHLATTGDFHCVAFCFTLEFTEMWRSSFHQCTGATLSNQLGDQILCMHYMILETMTESGFLIFFCIQTMKWIKLKTKRDLSWTK